MEEQAIPVLRVANAAHAVACLSTEATPAGNRPRISTVRKLSGADELAGGDAL